MTAIRRVSIAWDDNDRPVVTVDYRGPDELDVPMIGEPDAWLAALADRLTDKSATYLLKLAEITAARGFVPLADLAAELDVEKGEVDAWNRNLGRSIKGIVREYGFLRPDQEDGTYQLYDMEWDNDNNRWKYLIPAKFRDTLTAALSNR